MWYHLQLLKCQPPQTPNIWWRVHIYKGGRGSPPPPKEPPWFTLMNQDVWNVIREYILRQCDGRIGKKILWIYLTQTCTLIGHDENVEHYHLRFWFGFFGVFFRRRGVNYVTFKSHATKKCRTFFFPQLATAPKILSHHQAHSAKSTQCGNIFSFSCVYLNNYLGGKYIFAKRTEVYHVYHDLEDSFSDAQDIDEANVAHEIIRSMLRVCIIFEA